MMNKKAKGITGFTMAMLMMISVFMFALSNNTSITANVVKYENVDTAKNNAVIQTKEINSLSQLNEGWYEIRNGFVFYLEDFNTPIPLYIKIKNSNDNGLAVVDADGTVSFEETSDKLVEKIITDKDIRKNSIVESDGNDNLITGNVAGLTSVTGMQAATQPTFQSGWFYNVKTNQWTYAMRAWFDESKNIRHEVDQNTELQRNPPDDLISSNLKYLDVTQGGGHEVEKTGADWNREQMAMIAARNQALAEAKVQANAASLAKQGSGAVAPAPPLGAHQPAAPATPQSPSAPRPNPRDIKSGGQTAILANDGKYYYRTSDNVLHRYTGGTFQNPQYEDVKIMYDVTIRFSNGNTQNVQYLSTTADNAKKELERQGVTIIVKGEATSASVQSSQKGEYKIDSLAGIAVITNGLTVQPIPPEYAGNPQGFADMLNTQNRIREAYDSWRKANNLPNDAQTMVYFRDKVYKDSTDAINDALGLTTIEQATAQQKPTPVTFIDGVTPTGDWRLPDGRIVSEAEKNFYETYGNLKPETGVTTLNNQPVYLHQGKYIDGRGVVQSQLIREIPIGGTPYTITYSVTYNGNQKIETPQSIKIDGQQVPITAATLPYLGLMKPGDTLENTPNGLVINIALPSRDNGRTTVSRAVTSGRDGTISDQVTFTTRNRNGETTGLVITAQEKDRDGKITLNSRTEYSKDDDGAIYPESSDYVQIITDATGKPIGVMIRENFEEFAAGSLAGSAPPSDLAQNILDRETSQYEWRQRFATAERWLTEFRGLGYYATLFLGDDKVLAWRNSVDEVFSTLYLGTEYWSSGICGKFIESGDSEGLAFADTPQGVAQIAAHIEATRTKPIDTGAGNEYIYKITFSVRNGDYESDVRAPEKMNINVIVKGPTESKLFKNNVEIKRGDTFTKSGTKAIVKQSKKLYDKICIEFDQIPAKWHIDNKQLCNKIIEEQGTPVSLTQIQQQQQQQASGEPVLNEDW